MKELKDQYISIEHILLAIHNGNDTAAKLLKDNGITEKELLMAIKQLRKGSTVDTQTAEDTYNAMNRYARNLNEMARNGTLDPVIGRDEEIRRILQILSRRTKNNPILIGEPGVGKTAIAEGLAHTNHQWRCSGKIENKAHLLTGYGRFDRRGKIQRRI